MAIKKQKIKTTYQTYPGRTVESTVSNTQLLPGVHRTTRNQKYIDALLGELTSKGTLESFDGWVGSQGGQVRRKNDIYLTGDNRLAMGIKSPGGVVGDITDIANELSARENITFKDAKQLTSAKSYGYCPGINPDKFVNFQNYYWLRFDLPEIALDAGFFDNGNPASVNILTEIVGRAYYTSNKQPNGRKLTFRNGMKLYFIQRDNGQWVGSNDLLTIPPDSVEPKYFIVTGVGKSIQLLPYELYYDPLSLFSVVAPLPWDKKNWDRTLWDTDVMTPGGKQYSTIAIGSDNYNAWSRTNRWIHEQSAFETARFLGIAPGDILTEEDRASRPIVEFDRNIDLWNHGHIGKPPVDLITDTVSSLLDIEGTVNPSIDGYSLKENARILFIGGDASIKNKTFRAVDVATSVYFEAEDDGEPNAGETVYSKNGKYFATTLYYNGSSWIKAQQLETRGQPPLFRIFDTDGTPIEDYEVAAFSGSKIFGYATGTHYDRELNQSIAYDSSYKGSLSNNIGAIVFHNFLSAVYKEAIPDPLSKLVDLTSANYYREWNIYNDPMWHYRSGWRPVSQVYNVSTEHSTTVAATDITNGSVNLIGDQYIFRPTYAWNISTPDEVLNQSNRDFLLEESYADSPSREWFDPMVLAKFADNTIFNYTGRRIRLANQRGVVFLDSTDFAIHLPKELFNPTPPYTSTSIRPNDYIIYWKIGDYRWNVVNLISRLRDDPRRPEVYVNGLQRNPGSWTLLFKDNVITDANNIGLKVTDVVPGDLIDIVANGSMKNNVSEITSISNLSNNPYNEKFSKVAYGQLFGHFLSAIKKKVLPRFVTDLHHQDIQVPRFDINEGYNQPFGDNDWEFGDCSRQTVGNKILVHDSPANRYFWMMRAGEQGSVFPMLEDARKSYSNFKLKFIQKIERLYQDQDISNVQAAVDKALTDIFVGRNESFRYAHSHMVMWGTPDAEKIYTFADSTAQLEIDGELADTLLADVVDGEDADPVPPITILDGGLSSSFVDYECEIPSSAELGEISTDHVYVYYKNYNDKAWRILTYTKDYNIDQEAKTVHISAEFDTPCQFKICVFKKTRTSYVPPTPAKLGMIPWYHPEYYTDTTYEGQDVLFIQGHDGSLTPAWGDFRDDMLLEFERRVASSIGKDRGERAELLLNKFLPRRGRGVWYTKNELDGYLEDAWLTWANENKIVELPNLGHITGKPLTYNYSKFTAFDGSKYGSWRDLYRYAYGTDRPDTHPWELLGFARKPSWWDTEYSWTDPVKRNALIAALHVGNRSNEMKDTRSYLHHSHLTGPVTPIIPVDTNGSLINPIDSGWYVEANITEDTQNDWMFGNIGPQELAWRRSSDFSFSLATWLILSAGPAVLEAVWEGPRLVSSSVETLLSVDRDYGNIVKWGTANQHRETSTDIVPGYGMLVSELAASLSADQVTSIISEIRNVKSHLQWAAYGFLEANSLEFIADILIEQEKGNRLPAENYQIDLKVTSPSLVLTYSGVKVIVDENGGYRIDGFDNISTYFPYYAVKTNGPSIPVEVGTITYKKYTTFEKTLSYVDYGQVLSTRQEVINFLLGYGEFLKANGWKFEDPAPTQDDILDWSYSAREFATWSQTRWQANTQIALSPASQNLVLLHDTRFFGRLDTTFLSRTYLLDENSRRIDFQDTEVVREPSQTTIKSRPGVGIYFVRCGLEEYTHVVTFDDSTIFNDNINDYLFGISIKRLRAQGKRTKSWDGRPSGYGYIIRNSGVESNLDTISREIGDDYITVENRSANPWIRSLKKSQIGLSRPDDALLQTGFSRDTIDQFQSASLRRKGTPNIVEKFTKGLLGPIEPNAELSHPAGVTVKENWMFRMGDDIGNTGEKATWEIKIPPGSRESILDLLTIRAIPPFKENTYYETTVDKKSDNIIDLLGPKDSRWIKYPKAFELPMRSKTVTETDLPQAGIADRVETDYKYMDIDQLYDIDIHDDVLGEMSAVNSWSAKLPYDQDDLVRYKGQLYKANYSHLAKTTFNPDDWSAIEELYLPSIWLANKTPESNDIKDWTVLQTMDKNLGIKELCAGTFDDMYHPLCEMLPGVKHNLSVGDWVLILSTERTTLNGYYKVTKIRDSESFFFELQFNPLDFVMPEFAPGNTSAGGKLFVVKHTHFYTIAEMNATIFDPGYEWASGMNAYVDDRINEPSVYMFRGNFTLFNLSKRPYDNRALVFYDLKVDNVLHHWEANTEEYMPWLFSIGILLATFDKLKNGNIALTDSCPVSLSALGAPSPVLLSNTIPTVTVLDALKGIIFRQANDCAWVLAEKLYGSISAAAAAINTMFADDCIAFVANVNADTSGSSTAMDLAKIAKKVWSYADYQYLFVTQSWFFQGKIYGNKNYLIDNDGIGIMALENETEDDNGNPLVEYHMIGVKAYGERELMIVSTGYRSLRKRNADSLALLDTVNAFGNYPGTFSQIPFIFDRRLGDIVDQKRITNVEIVDYETNKVLATLKPYDPAAGILPSYVDSFVDWKEHEDPANYTNADLDGQSGYSVRPRFAWFDDHQGQVWWDLSAVRYYDYYQGTAREKAYQWGKQFPGSTIQVYEWVKSVVSPKDWAESARTGFLVDFETVTGSPYHSVVNGEKKYFWSERQEKDKSGVLRTYYYFWVSGMDRTYSNKTNITSIATATTGGGGQVYARSTAGIPATTNKFNVTQIASVINNPRVSGATWFAGIQNNSLLISGVNKLLGNAGAVLRIEVDGNVDTHSEWLLLKENDNTSSVSDWLHIRMRDSIIGSDQTETVYDIQKYTPGFAYSRGQVVDYKGTYYRAFRDFLPTDIVFGDGSLVLFVSQPWQKLWNYRQITTTSIGEIQGKDVPDYKRHPYNRYGNEIRPTQQSWLNDRIEAIRVFVDAANRELAKINVTGITGWDTRLSKIIPTNDPVFVYDISTYWDYVDYIDASYDETKAPVIVLNSLRELYDEASAMPGDYVTVLLGDEQIPNIWQKLNGGWKLMYQKNGTIQLTKRLFDLAKIQDLWDASPWDSLRWDNYPFVELFEIITALREDIFVDAYQIHYTTVFFALVREVLRQNPTCHWIRKSSYVDIERVSADEIKPVPFYRKEYLRNDDNVLVDFVNEVKPYHTKILNQVEVDQLLESANISFEDDNLRKMEITMRYDRHGDSTWKGYFIDGHPFNQLQEGWDRNPWEFEFTAEGLLPATGERVSRMKNYMWDMDQPKYEALIDTIIAGHSFGVQPEALQAIIDGNAFYQPDWDSFPEELLPLHPGENVEIRVINNRNGDTVDEETVSWRYHMDILGGLKVYRYNTVAQTIVTVGVDETSTEIQLADTSVLTRPDPVNGKPGVVWLARERIEFWEIDGNTIKRLVRGTLGTPVLPQASGRKVYDGGQQNQVPTPEDLINWHDNLYPMWNESGKTLLDSETREALFLKDGPGYFIPG